MANNNNKAKFIAKMMSKGMSKKDARAMYEEALSHSKPKKASKRMVRQEKKRGLRGNMDITWSSCAKKYARTRYDPFNAPAGACVPDGTTQASRREKVWIRSTMVVGQDGVGWIAYVPKRMSFSDADALIVSNAASTGTVITNAPANVTTLRSNSPFATTDPRVRSRVVGAGLRIQYVGRQLDAGGTIYGLAEPDAQGLEGADATALGQYDEVKALPVDASRKWAGLRFFPRAEQDLEFGNVTNPTANITTESVFYVTGLPAGTVFNFEAVVHLEFVGPVTGKLASHQDPLGKAAVDGVLVGSKYLSAGYSISGQVDQFMHDLGDYARKATSFVTTAAPLAAAVSAALL